MAQDHQNSSKTSLLREMRENVDWENEDRRYEFLKKIRPLIENWIDGLPNLRDIFQHDEIKRLLEGFINYDRRDKDKNELIDQFLRFVIRTGYKDEPELDEDRNPVLHRTTPVHLAGREENPWLSYFFKIYDRFDVNYTDEDGYTHFHAACKSGCIEAVEKFLEFGQDPNLVWQKTGESPLHMVVLCSGESTTKVVELLLKKGADPTLSNAEGSTPLHLIRAFGKGVDCAKTIFEINNDIRARLVSARDKLGHTPLHVAMRSRCVASMELLLTKGADQNAANDNGETPLHIISRYDNMDNLARMFFWICEKEKKTLQLDAKDKRGWTPLHLATNSGTRFMVESLLERGADPHLANVDGKTPLHVLCDQGDDEKAKVFFEICEERKETLQLDARDNLGRTPLQYAVSQFQPHTVDLLLERGADLSGFIFPTEHEISGWLDALPDTLVDLSSLVYPAEFGMSMRLDALSAPSSSLVLPTEHETSEKLHELAVILQTIRPTDFWRIWRRASQVLNVVESLGDSGYAFDVSQVQSIMKALARHELWKMSLEPDERLCLVRYLYSKRLFTKTAKEIMIKSRLSLYDLLKLRPEKARKLLTSADHLRLAYSTDLNELDGDKLEEICVVLICDMMLQRFCKLIALVPFLALTHYRLPISHCQIILEKLTNEDLFKLCLLANGQN